MIGLAGMDWGDGNKVSEQRPFTGQNGRLAGQQVDSSANRVRYWSW